MLQVGTQQGGSSMNESRQELLNLERKSCERLGWTHLEQVQHCIAQPGNIFSAHRAGQDGARVGMNITAHQKKTKGRKKKKRKQANDFKEAVCCPSTVVQKAALQKNEGECPG